MRLNRGDAGNLAGMGNGRDPAFPGEGERRCVRLRRKLRLKPAKPNTDNTTIAITDGVTSRGLGKLQREATRDIRGEANLDAVQLTRLFGAIAIPLEDGLPGDSANYRLGRREDPLYVDRTVPGSLSRVVDHHLAEVVRGTQGGRGHHPHFDEVREVAKPEEIGQALDRIGRQGHVIAPRDLEQSRRTYGALEVDVQLNLGIRHGGAPFG